MGGLGSTCLELKSAEFRARQRPYGGAIDTFPPRYMKFEKSEASNSALRNVVEKNLPGHLLSRSAFEQGQLKTAPSIPGNRIPGPGPMQTRATAQKHTFTGAQCERISTWPHIIIELS